MTTTDHALAALAKPPHGIVGSIDNAAIEAAGGDIRTARVVVQAVEPLIVEDVVARILRGSTTTTERTVRYHYADGRPPMDCEPTDETLAREAADRFNQDDTTEYRRGESIDRAEVVSREVWCLRDGSTLTGPWHVPATEGRPS